MLISFQIEYFEWSVTIVKEFVVNKVGIDTSIA